MNDTSVARNLALVSGSARIDIGRTLHALSPQEGMLYYHLLLARLETRDDVGRASVPGRREPMSKIPFAGNDADSNSNPDAPVRRMTKPTTS
jgi:hypothetical protein